MNQENKQKSTWIRWISYFSQTLAKMPLSGWKRKLCPKKCGDKLFLKKKNSLRSHCMQGEEDWSKQFTLFIVVSFNLCIQSFLAFCLFSRWIRYDFKKKCKACFQWDFTLDPLHFGCILVEISHTNFTIPRFVWPGPYFVLQTRNANSRPKWQIRDLNDIYLIHCFVIRSQICHRNYVYSKIFKRLIRFIY